MATWGDKTWLITGASSGFGRAMADLVLSKGGRVIATARDAATLAGLVASSDGCAIAVALDVSDRRQTAAAMERVAAFGGADVLFNNAGYGFLGGLEESALDEIDAQFDVHLFAPIRLAKAVLPGMRERGRGFILNMSSIAGVKGFPGSPFYTGSKAALAGVSESLAGEVAPFGIGVMVIEPGFFRTDFLDASSVRYGSQSIADYATLPTPPLSTYEAYNHQQPGDPAKLGRAFIELTAMPTPPLHFVAGSDALGMARETFGQRMAEVEAHAGLSASLDRDDV